jgi:transcriptional regulator with XRE-family HTH domain
VLPGASALGHRLRDQREHRGVTLDAIAADTKIKASLLAALERGDVTAWPPGIFRRAFLREYATAIGLSAEPIVAEFARLCPEPGQVDTALPPQVTSALRMTLANEREGMTSAAVIRVVIALLEVCLIVAVSIAAAWIQGVNAWRMCAALALICYPIATAFPGRGRTLRYIRTRFHKPRKSARTTAATDVRGPIQVVARRSTDPPLDWGEDFTGTRSVPFLSRAAESTFAGHHAAHRSS